MADRDEVSIDVQNDITRLRTTATNLLETVGRLNNEVSGLMALNDGGVYGEAYATDQGPAVRARFLEGYARSSDDNGRRITEPTEQVSGLEATTVEFGNWRCTIRKLPLTSCGVCGPAV